MFYRKRNYLRRKKPINKVSKNVKSAINTVVRKKVTNAHLAGIHRLSGIDLPDRMMKAFRFQSGYALNNLTGNGSAVQITMDGTHRVSFGFSSFNSGNYSNGIYHFFGSQYPNGSSALGTNTGMYNGFRVWKNKIKLTFVPSTSAVSDTYLVYGYPTNENNNGQSATITISNITEQKHVKFYYLQSNNTANPRTLTWTNEIPKLLGIDPIAYTGPSYDVTMQNGVSTAPSASGVLNTYFQFGVIPILPSTGAGSTAIGVFNLEMVEEYEFFDRNQTTQLVPT